MEAKDTSKIVLSSTAVNSSKCHVRLNSIGMAALMFLGFFALYAMTTNTENASLIEYCNQFETDEQAHPVIPIAIGQLISAIPAGLLTYKYSACRLFGVSIIGSGLSHLMLPLTRVMNCREALLSFAINILKGFFEGMALPAMHALLRYWAPPSFNTCYVSWVLFGAYLGIPASNKTFFQLLSGFNIYLSFYIFGAFSIILGCIWLFTASDRPKARVAIQPGYVLTMNTTITQLTKVPWKAMFTSTPVLAIVIVSFCCGWNLFFLIKCAPADIDTIVILYKIPVNAMENQIEYVAKLCDAFLPWIILNSGLLADYLRKLQLSTGFIRKLFTSGGLAITVILAPFIGIIAPNSIDILTWSFACIRLLFGVVLAGFMVNHLDIAPHYAGILMSFTVVSQNAGFLLARVFLDSLGPDKINDETIEEEYFQTFKTIYIVTVVINLLAGLFYAVFSSGRKQIWANIADDESTTISV